MPSTSTSSAIIDGRLPGLRSDRGDATLLRTPDLFADRRAEAEEAAELIGRIRIDEAIHVSSLCLYLGECASVSFRTNDGGKIAGRELIDRFWSGLVRWASVEQPAITAKNQRQLLHDRVAKHPRAASVWSEFEAAA